ncbi:MAG: ATP-dependent DNA helicase RecG [Actinobacteria bacterium]|nr:ATP-dependent DNA helicase RecG [Actinomycetota bacterium]
MVGWGCALETVLGGKTAAALARQLDLHTVGDLLRHYPRRYDERAGLTDLSQLVIGEQVTVLAEVVKVTTRRMRQRSGRLLEVVVGDGHGSLTLTFFNQAWRERELYPGRRGLFAGKVTEFNRTRQLNKPDYLLLPEDGAAGDAVEEFVGALVPVYPATLDVRSWVISRSVRLVLDQLDPVPDPLPVALRRRHRLVDRGVALRDIHLPPDRRALTAARTRLKWDEAMAVQVTLAQRRRAALADPAVPWPPHPDGVRAAFDAALPFTLTAGQREVGEQIAADLARAHPMHRLLQGEVGSGKTLVALRAMLQVVDGGGQAALLAPTEVLAAQHARSLTEMLGPLARAGELGAAETATRLTLLTGSLPAAARRRALLAAASGEAGIVVGTHALIQDRVQFAALGLVVVDEQHRFGVEQRDALRAKGERPPHLLVMTATPIPRTVAMTVFGDLETSALRELPAGRSPIATSVVPGRERPAWLDRAWQRIREEVAAGRQAYVVCPRIGDGESADDTAGPDTGEPDTAGPDLPGTTAAGEDRRAPLAVADVLPTLAAGPLAGLRLGELHGRLPADVKDDVMRRFTTGEIDVLVATTVVEVGVDVPNATVMAVLDADRFGVSQLHQLRGRVGRGRAPGLCLLVTDAGPGTPARERLDAVASTQDGFELARLDLEQRREGDVLGAAQSGRQSQLSLLSLLRDEQLIVDARAAASELVDADPDLAGHPVLAAEVAALLTAERAEYLEKA